MNFEHPLQQNEAAYRLKIRFPQGDRTLLYRPHVNVMTWDDSGQNLDLGSFKFLSRQHGDQSERREFPVITPDRPGKKIKDLTSVKIQLGLKCNYSCQYCSQGGQSNRLQGEIKDVETFLAKMPTWFNGGEDGLGEGVRFEFWGGEPLVYWKILKPLAEGLKARYPNGKMNVISNGSLLREDIIDWFDQIGMSVGISHDGPGYAEARGEDPLVHPERKKMIRLLFDRLSPTNRIGFNCVVTKNNYSLKAIRDDIAGKLGVPSEKVNLSSEEILLPYDTGGLALSPKTDDEHDTILQSVFWEAVKGQTMTVSTLKEKVESFIGSLVDRRPSYVLSQKCGMDRWDNISVNMKGDVVTCQNTSAESGHKIGHVDDFENVKLTTAYHWRARSECTKCPVVQLCRGACMYVKSPYWETACDNSFTWNLAVLGVSLYWLTRGVLVEIEGPVLRRDSLPNRMPVITFFTSAVATATGPAEAAPVQHV